jgi:hypothetical protein
MDTAEARQLLAAKVVELRRLSYAELLRYREAEGFDMTGPLGTCFRTSCPSSPGIWTAPTRTRSRTQTGPKPLPELSGKAKDLVSDQVLVVEVGRLELPSHGVVPGLLRAQPSGQFRAEAVRWHRSPTLARKVSPRRRRAPRLG